MHRCCTDLAISIHALREEGDFAASPAPCWYRLFLSTPSARRATRSTWMSVLSLPISIHALREEGDLIAHALIAKQNYFYPRPPRGGRRIIPVNAELNRKFLSTPSARRATSPRSFGGRIWIISIHALREEGDPCTFPGYTPRALFLSTPSARRATARKMLL